MRVRLKAACLAGALLWLSACEKRPAPAKKPNKIKTSPAQRRSGGTPALARWLKRVPADARWALASVDLGRLRSVLADAEPLMTAHPRLAPTLRQWRADLERVLGDWPLEPKSWAQLGLEPGAGGVLYRRRDGKTVLLFTTRDPARVLGAVQRALHRRGSQPTATLQQIRLQGQPAYRLAGWTCTVRNRLCACADVAPPAQGRTTAAPRRSLWTQVLGRHPRAHRGKRVGIWLGGDSDLGRSVGQTVDRLVGQRPQGIWLGLSLDRRLAVYGLAVGVRPKPGPRPRLPKPGSSGLAAADSTPLVLRLRVAPAALLAHAGRLLPMLQPVLHLLGQPGAPGRTLAQELLSGEVVLLSGPTGLALILGLQSARSRRALQKLWLLFAPQVSRWKKRVRARGPGWDLIYRPASPGTGETHRLTLRLPPKPGPGAPQVAKGHLTLLWTQTPRHLVLANTEKLLQRVLARVPQPDTRFLQHLADAAARRGFAEHRILSVHLTPDDPLGILPGRQRAAARRWLDELAPADRRWTTGWRLLADLTDTAELSCAWQPAGLGCHLSLALILSGGQRSSGSSTGPSPTPARPAGDPVRAYRQALRKKWGGHSNGYLRQLAALAAEPRESAARRKAGRILAHRRAPAHHGLLGQWVSLWLPWARHRLIIAARQEAPRELARLMRSVQALAERAAKRPLAARRRWHRGLRSTGITPARRCCKQGVRRCESRARDWAHPTWKQLGFAQRGPHLYRYQLLVEPGSMQTRITLRATGDLDCNGRSSLLSRTATVDAATGRLSVGPLTRVRADQ